ncbi:MAG: glucosamine inositolphosphorylceramide transferase family protein [Candidatus Rokuibacteriota bacterium]
MRPEEDRRIQPRGDGRAPAPLAGAWSGLVSRVGRTPLRFGVLCHGTTFPAWQAECLRHLLELDGTELVLLVIDTTPRPFDRPPPRSRLRRLLSGGFSLWDLYCRLVVDRQSPAHEPIDLSRQLTGVPTLRCAVVREGRYSEYFTDEDIEAMRSFDLDFALRFAFGIIRGKVLDVARYGVWSFHHGDMDRYRGGPPGFWEIYHDAPVTGSVLQRLTHRLDGGRVLHRGYFATIDDSYVQNRDQALLGAAGWPARVCRDIQEGVAGYLDAPPSASRAALCRAPTNRQMFRHILKQLRNHARRSFHSIFWREQWNVGVVRLPIHAFLDTDLRPAIQWLPASPGYRYVADPFGLSRDAHVSVLVEEYDYRAERGHISVVEMASEGMLGPPRSVITLREHVSYPYLFEHDGQHYCVPEMHRSNEIRLFKAEPFPHRWVGVATLVTGFAAVDPTIFRHEGLWWLFCTNARTGASLRLYAWHATDLMGPWIPHTGNPIKCDIRSSRPAGTPFVYQGQLYRPAQDCSRTYGGAVSINRVARLTPGDFAEEVVRVVEPDPAGPWPLGLHTLSSAGEITLVDGKRRVFVVSQFRIQLIGRLGALLSRVPRTLGSGRRDAGSAYRDREP